MKKILNPVTKFVLMLVQADYTRYEGAHLRKSLANVAVQPGAAIERRLCSYLRPKCHPILLDSSLNSRSTVCLNIFQASSALTPKSIVSLHKDITTVVYYSAVSQSILAGVQYTVHCLNCDLNVIRAGGSLSCVLHAGVLTSSNETALLPGSDAPECAHRWCLSTGCHRWLYATHAEAHPQTGGRCTRSLWRKAATASQGG